jgi:beta-glucosidase-like glycosyl hydrolase
LWWETGNAIGREARAFQNAGLAGSTYWAPVINIVRDPRWGRNIETPGEDPFLTGQYAINFVQGLEHSKEDPYGALQASGCVKHFVANELDGWNGTNRNHIDVFVPQQDLADSYLPPFADGVQEGKVSGVMCSYNAVNGVPSCASDWLLGTVLRQTWEFDGYVTSDCDAGGYKLLLHRVNDEPATSGVRHKCFATRTTTNNILCFLPLALQTLMCSSATTTPTPRTRLWLPSCMLALTWTAAVS